MSQPIILDGGAQMITIKLPASFTKDAEAGKFSVSPEPENEHFKSIVVMDPAGQAVFKRKINGEERWKIVIE